MALYALPTTLVPEALLASNSLSRLLLHHSSMNYGVPSLVVQPLESLDGYAVSTSCSADISYHISQLDDPGVGESRVETFILRGTGL